MLHNLKTYTLMTKEYRCKNTNTENIDQINIVSKYITSSFGRSEVSHFAKFNHKFPQYRNLEEIITVILNYDKLIINNDTVFITTDMSNIRKYCDSIYKSITNIPKGSFVSFIFHGVLGRSITVSLVDMFINQIGCKGLLIQPYSLNMCIGLGIQHCILVDEYSTHTNVYIVDDYVLHDCFTVKKSINYSVSVCLPDDQDYVEDYQKLRMIEDIPYYGCKICDYKSKVLFKVQEHLKINHFFSENDKNMIFKYENNHEDCIQEIVKRLRFLYFNLERLKRMNIRVVHNNYNNINDLCEQLKFLYNNVIPIQADDSVIFKGNELFNTLELSKECWITDKEWNAGKLRVLKDKILFNL